MERLRGVNLTQIRKYNLISTINIIKDHGPISRIDIGKHADFSPGTCTNITKILLERKLIRETSTGESRGGRKPTLLELNYNRGFVAGIEITDKIIRCKLYNLELQSQKKEYQCIFKNEKDILTAIKKSIDNQLSHYKIDKKDLFGIVIGVPGIVDTIKHGMIVSTNLKINSKIDIYDSLRERYKTPIYIENVGNLIALAEKNLVFKTESSLVSVIIKNSGIGSGIILNNEIFFGSFEDAGDIGHITIDRNGPECVCGNRGCLEAIGNIPAIKQKAIHGMMSGRKTQISKLADNDISKISLEIIRQAFDENDEFARSIIEEEADILYNGVLAIINTFNPEVIVFSGEISKFGDYLITRIKDQLKKTIFAFYIDRIVICYSELGDDAPLLGAGIFAANNFFKNPEVLFK